MFLWILVFGLDQDLWEAIKTNYDNKNYSGAIKDSIIYLTNVIRDKTGLERWMALFLLDKLLGGKDPRIRLNKLQTDSEKDVQKGIQELLRGVYSAIRNPRNHEKSDDTKEDADLTIALMAYLLKVIDKSKLRFDEEIFFRKVFDKYYVKTKEYSELLVAEIPKRQRADIAIKVILRREEGDIYNLECFMESLFDKLDEGEINRVYEVISDQLRLAQEDIEIRTILKICPAEYWKRIDKTVRLRIENLLLENVKKGRYNSELDKLFGGFLGTWISPDHLKNFENLSKWNNVFINMLRSRSEEEFEYISIYFWDKICYLNRDNIYEPLKKYISIGLKENNSFVVNKIDSVLSWDKEHPWWKVFEKELEPYPDIKPLEFIF